jgi:hypothetical protein
LNVRRASSRNSKRRGLNARRVWDPRRAYNARRASSKRINGVD